MTQESLSLTMKTKDVENGGNEEIDGEIIPSLSPFSLENLPDVFLQHLVPFLKWKSRRSLSQVNSRFRGHYESVLKEAQSLSIKGQISVGVGDTECQCVSFLSEFYTIRIEMDDEMVVEWTLKLESGIRTVVNTVYDGKKMAKETTRSVALSSKDYLEKMVKWILNKYQFRKIHLGVPGLASLFDSYNYKVNDVGVSDEAEYLELAERFQPKKLTLFPPNQITYKKGVLDLKKFPQLEEIRMYGVPLDLEQIVDSKLSRIVADTVAQKIKLRHAKRLIENWKTGSFDYKKIEITCTSFRLPTYLPHEKWTEFKDDDLEEYYDHIENNKKKTGSFSYSSRRLEFTSWEANNGKQPNFWTLHY